MPKIFLGIDIGTTALKIIAADQSGMLLGKTYKEYVVSRPAPNQVEQDMEMVWEMLLDSMREIITCLPENRRQEVDAISLSTQRSTMVPVDCKGNPLRPAITWLDSRSGEQCEELARSLGERAVYQSTGNSISTIWTFSYIMWMKKWEPEIYHKTACFANVHSFIMKRLGCQDYFLDYSNAGETMMFDLQGQCWSSMMLEYVGLDEKYLPRLTASGVPIGILDHKLSHQLGLPQGVKLISGGGDQQCAALGCGVLEDGDIAIGMGTAANILALSRQYRLDESRKLIANCSVLAGKYFLEGSLLASGPIFNWVRNLAYKQEMERLDQSEVYALMNDEVRHHSVPGANGVILLPHLQGAGCPYWNENATGVFSGLTLMTTRADLVRAVMEGMAIEVNKSLHLLKQSGFSPQKIVLTGGASRSDIWCQIQADVYGLPLYVPDNPDVAGIGAVILAAVGVGAFSTAEDGAAIYARNLRVYQPDRENHERYDALTQYSERLYQAVSTVACKDINPR